MHPIEDFLKLESLFSGEELQVRDTVRKFVTGVTPLFAEAFEVGTYPAFLTAQMAELGLFGLTLPKAYGGSEASYVAYGLACQELEHGDTSLRSFVSVQNSLCMYSIMEMGDEAQKSRFLPLMKEGKVIGCFGLTEPDAGSDPSSMRTYAKKVAGGYLLNGRKMWITNAPLADLAICFAKTDDGIRGFMVEKDFQGFERHEIKHKLASRASVTGELTFTDCFVPDSHYLPGSDQGLASPLKCLTQARYGIAWGAIGAAIACFEAALAYTQAREQFGKPLAGFQLVQKDLADMLTEISKAQAFNLHVGRLMDAGQADYALVSMAKMNACREALKIARMARNLLGANGITLGYPVIRHMTNLESVFTYEGTDNIHHLIIGRAITGLSAFA